MPDLFSDFLADPAVTTVASAIVLAGVALWIAAAWWAYNDAARRTGSLTGGLVAAGWIILSTPLLLPFSLPVYALARPQQSAADRRARALVRALVDTVTDEPGCFACGDAIDPTWLRCPTCSTWLAAPCSACGQWSERLLEICPWCGSEGRDEPSVEIMTPAANARLLRRRAGSGLRAVGPGRSRPQRGAAAGRVAVGPGVESRHLAPLRLRG